MTSPDVLAVAAFPELQRLIDLRDAGWTFQATGDDGHVSQVHGYRIWPGNWVDFVFVRYLTDVAAVRCTGAGDIVWGREGGLVEVVDCLIDLPAPDARLAPRLVIGSSGLWTP
ncbi:hypothetical protein [Actinokineospora enzanensis]|uniref:hypothetical protein n=1 Tax=Actinokineospora enzanensis TaxID=155975 RepID=UPI00036F7899|nr:hypothetical protein [Actinokineospora enzanensis]